MNRGDALAAWAAFAVVAGLAFTFGFHRIDSSDIWIHLASGEHILDHGRVPDRDPFAAESPAPEWLNAQWLAETVLAALHRLGGWPLLVCASALAACASIVLPFAWALRHGAPGLTGAWPFAAAAILASLIAYERFFVRPEAITFLFTAIWVGALGHADLSRRRTLLLLVLLQIVWCNTHAAFPLGIAFASAAAIGPRLDRRRADAPPAAAWWLPLALVVASCVNPYGPRLPLHVSRSLLAIDQGPLQEGVVEWQPTFASVDLAAIASDITLVTFIASLGLVAAVLVYARRDLRVAELLVVVGMTALALLARRHLAVYAVSVLPLAAAALSRRAVMRRGAWPAAATALLALGLMAGLVRGDFYARFGPPRVTGWGLSETDHPIAAADVLRRLDVRSPVFTNIAAGSYLLWACRGAPAPFVDGRLLAPERFARYRAALSSTRAFGALAQAQRFEAALLSLTPHPPEILFRHLVDLAAWHLVYLDGEGALFVHADVALRHPDLPSLDPDHPLPALAATAGASRAGSCDPGPDGRRGEVLLRLGYPAAAAADLSRALERCQDPRLAALLRAIDSRRAPPAP